VPDGRKAEENKGAVQAGPVPDGRKAEENKGTAQVGPVLDGRKAEENKGTVQAEPVPDGRKAEENKGTAQAGPVPDGRTAEEVTARARDLQRAGRKAGTDGILELKDGCVYRKGMLWIPNNKTLVCQILESEHDTKIAGHMGQDKTIELIRRNFWWPKMDEQIIDFVRSCTQCQKDKAARHQLYGLLNPLELPYTPWQSIAMDFMTDLPLSEGCDQLWVIIDRFTKMAHFVPLPKSGKTASDLARIFVREIWRHHGLP
jgi:hypothetical protein